MVVRSGPHRGVGIETPQQHSAVGFPQLVEVAGRESPGHTAVEHDLEYFRLQETDLVCHCDVWVVVHRPAVLEEAVSGVASTAFDLRANVPNATDGAAKIHEGVDLAVPLPRGLHGNRFCLHGGGRMCIVTVLFSDTMRPNAAQTSTMAVIIVSRLA